MGGRARELTIFVSSTVRHMQQERERLVTRVFPELRARLSGTGWTLWDMDLRWGVPEETVDARPPC